MLSNRLNVISPSCTIGISSKVKNMRESGIDVINLSIGEPDFNVPKKAIECGIKSLNENCTKYDLVPGLISLREEICKKLSEENKKAIEYFVDNGGQFTLATGRMLPSIKRHIHKMKVTLPVIMYNGTKVYDFNSDEVIWEKFLEEERKEIVKVVNKVNHNIGIEIYSNEQVYIYQACKRTERFSKLGYDVIYNVDDSIWNKKWTKALIVGEKEELDFVETYLRKDYGDNNIVRSSDVYLEIIPKEISKGLFKVSITMNKPTIIPKI